MDNEKSDSSSSISELEQLAMPLVEYISRKHNERTTVIVTGTSFELLEVKSGKYGASQKEFGLEIEEKFEPNNGDFIFIKLDAEDTEGAVVIYSHTKDSDTDHNTMCYHAMLSYDDINLKDSAADLNCWDILRLTTDSEKKQLLEALAKEGKCWNAETKTVEDIYQPEEGEIVKIEHSEGSDILYFTKDKRTDTWLENMDNLCFYGSYPYGGFEIKPATENEKETLKKFLKEKNLQWNAETKQIEDIQWKPDFDEYYFSPCVEDDDLYDQWSYKGSQRDIEVIKKGLCFKTKEEAIDAANKMLNALK